MPRARLLLLVIITVVVPAQALATLASQVCIDPADSGGSRTAVHSHDHAGTDHDHAGHEHRDPNASGTVHCEACSSASIALGGTIFLAPFPQPHIGVPSERISASTLPYELDRPPAA